MSSAISNMATNEDGRTSMISRTTSSESGSSVGSKLPKMKREDSMARAKLNVYCSSTLNTKACASVVKRTTGTKQNLDATRDYDDEYQYENGGRTASSESGSSSVGSKLPRMKREDSMARAKLDIYSKNMNTANSTATPPPGDVDVITTTKRTNVTNSISPMNRYDDQQQQHQQQYYNSEDDHHHHDEDDIEYNRERIVKRLLAMGETEEEDLFNSGNNNIDDAHMMGSATTSNTREDDNLNSNNNNDEEDQQQYPGAYPVSGIGNSDGRRISYDSQAITFVESINTNAQSNEEERTDDDDVIVDDAFTITHMNAPPALSTLLMRQQDNNQNHREEDEQDKVPLKHKLYCICCIAALIIIVVIAFVVYATKYSSSSSSSSSDDINTQSPIPLPTISTPLPTISTPPPTQDFSVCFDAPANSNFSERYNTIRGILEDESLLDKIIVDAFDQFDVPSSPQRMALCWIADYDDAQLAINVGNARKLLQRYTVAVLNYAFVGEDNLIFSDWLTASYECEWEGIGCSVTSIAYLPAAVSNLTLDGRSLSGPIPLEITDLGKALVSFNIEENNVNGTIPGIFRYMPKLISLVLAKNPIGGTLSTEVGIAANLVELVIDNTNLAGSLPTEIGKLVNLEYLNFLQENRSIAKGGFNGTIPSEIGLLTKLKKLHGGDNMLTGSIPAQIQELTDLLGFEFKRNKLSGIIPTGIGLLTKLDTIMLLGNSNLNGTLPSELGNLDQLHSLALDTNEFTGTVPSELGRLTNMFGLYLQSNDFDRPFPDEVCNLRSHNSELEFLEVDCSLGTPSTCHTYCK